MIDMGYFSILASYDNFIQGKDHLRDPRENMHITFYFDLQLFYNKDNYLVVIEALRFAQALPCSSHHYVLHYGFSVLAILTS